MSELTPNECRLCFFNHYFLEQLSNKYISVELLYFTFFYLIRIAYTE